MALKVLQPGLLPLGQFDMMDGYLSTLKGGEIGTLVALPRKNTATEKAAADVFDGYTTIVAHQRAGIMTFLSGNGLRPLWLLDEGTVGYGTLFGQVIGTPTGLSTTGANLGPHTAAASGKVTAWDKPGLYGVTLDAVDVHPTLGLLPTNTSLTPGVAIYPTAQGLLTPSASRAAGGAIGADVVARFVEFETTGISLVRTPASLVGGLEVFDHVVISYHLNN
jgi:hypothetical protein